MAKQAVILFEREKDTKNAIRYQERPTPGQPPIVGTLYVQKWWADGAVQLHVTVERTNGA